MIRFVDLENHNVFDGSKPYVFWMDKEQSVNLIYVKRICVLSDQELLRVYLPQNDVFQFINMQNVDQYANVTVNDFDYKDLRNLYTYDYESVGVSYDGYFLHMIYIAGQSTAIGEFHEDFTIGNGNDSYQCFEIAADFYAEDENLKINLANFGVEIPESIQNAIYDVNIHEEANDNITLNRKYKELLLQYWNIVANRGSYKSLLNSLSWFEYGDIVQLNELWRHPELKRTVFSRGKLNTELTETIKSTLSSFAKTTYIGLYAAMEKFVEIDGEVQHDHHMSNKGFLGEETPLLEELAMRWTREEMSLKMYLLGCFYEAYFMPIHLDLIHSTIEDIVFTNTIKVLSANNLGRFDYVSNFDSFESNIKDGDVFQLEDVRAQAGDKLLTHITNDESTPLARVYNEDSSEDMYDLNSVGVEDEYAHNIESSEDNSDDNIVDDRLKTFMINYYDGVGVVVPIYCTMDGDEKDFVNKEVIRVITYVNDEQGKKITHEKTLVKHEMYPCVDGKIHVNFNLLLTEEGETVLNFGFYTAGGRTYVRSIHIRVLGDTLCRIRLYRVKANGNLELTDDTFNKSVISGTNEYRDSMIRPFNDYMFSHVRNDERLRDYENDKDKFMELAGYHRIFIPGINYLMTNLSDEVSTISDKNGIQLNYVCIINEAGLDWLSRHEVSTYNTFMEGSFDKDDPDYSLRGFDLAVRKVHADPNDEDSEVIDTYYTFISRYFVDLYEEGTFTYDDLKDSVERAAKARKNDLTNKPIVVIRNDNGFFPQKHYLEEMGVRLKYELDDEGNEVFVGVSHGQSIDDYTVDDRDTVVAVPEAKYNKLKITDEEWIFINKSQIGEDREIKMISTKEPFIGKDIKRELEPGFYDVIFRYKVGNTPQEIRLNSAFRKVSCDQGAFIRGPIQRNADLDELRGGTGSTGSTSGSYMGAIGI